ncbi:MAG TPA: hydroxylamine reductase, partial [Methylothermaceae bacterium]|nr:hydroxylamine reductase [Methylothermaceae bacterium]
MLHLLLALSFLVTLPASAATDPKALIDQYHRDHPGKGKYADHWQPIPIQRYWNPKDFYQPPRTVQGEVGRDQGVTPGFVRAWRDSTHARLDRIRTLPDSDVRAYKKQLLAEVEANLVRQGLLKPGKHLEQVSCIDCHGGIGKNTIRHDQDLRMPDRAVCGTCHVQQFAEAESEKEQTWPQGQWPKGHPSHAVDWKANVETAVWAAMTEREIAQGCDQCHYQQNKCDGCHTRHSFSAAEARRPEACATCHNGVDHNEYENYLLSKHGTVYQTHKHQWNFEAPL